MGQCATISVNNSYSRYQESFDDISDQTSLATTTKAISSYAKMKDFIIHHATGSEIIGKICMVKDDVDNWYHISHGDDDIIDYEKRYLLVRKPLPLDDHSLMMTSLLILFRVHDNLSKDDIFSLFNTLETNSNVLELYVTDDSGRDFIARKGRSSRAWFINYFSRDTTKLNLRIYFLCLSPIIDTSFQSTNTKEHEYSTMERVDEDSLPHQDSEDR